MKMIERVRKELGLATSSIPKIIDDENREELLVDMAVDRKVRDWIYYRGKASALRWIYDVLWDEVRNMDWERLIDDDFLKKYEKRDEEFMVKRNLAISDVAGKDYEKLKSHITTIAYHRLSMFKSWFPNWGEKQIAYGMFREGYYQALADVHSEWSVG